MRDRERERTVLLLQPFVVQVRPTAIIRLCVCVFAIHFMVTVVWSAEGVSVRFWMTLIAPCMPLKVGYKTQVTAHYLN